MRFIVYGDPVGKARARTVRVNGITRSFTPSKTAEYEDKVTCSYINSPDKFENPMDRPVKISIDACFKLSKNDSKRTMQKKLDGEIRPTKKPDADNIAKIVCDALNGIAYKDDSVITSMTVRKMYSLIPRVEVEIEEDVADDKGQ